MIHALFPLVDKPLQKRMASIPATIYFLSLKEKAKETARMRIAVASLSLEQITANYEEEQQRVIKVVKRELKELRDNARGEERIVYDNFYRTAHMQVLNNARKKQTVGMNPKEELPSYETLTPLVLASAPLAFGGARKKKDNFENLVHIMIGNAIERNYSERRIQVLLEDILTGTEYPTGLPQLTSENREYIREEVLPNLPDYMRKVGFHVMAGGKERRKRTKSFIGTEKREGERRSSMFERGFQRFRNYFSEREVIVVNDADDLFDHYHALYKRKTQGTTRSRDDIFLYTLLSTAASKGYNGHEMEKLLEYTCDEEKGNNRNVLSKESTRYIRSIDLPTYMKRIEQDLRGSQNARVSLEEGLAKLERKVSEDEKQAIREADVLFAGYTSERNPLATLTLVVSKNEMHFSERSVWTDTLRNREAQQRQGRRRSLIQGIAAAAIFLVSSVMSIGGVYGAIQNYQGKTEYMVSHALTQVEQGPRIEKEMQTEPILPHRGNTHAIQYEPQTAPAYDSANPAPWYQIEKAQLSADGSSLELKLGNDLKEEGRQIRLRYETPEGKTKIKYATPHLEQTLHVHGIILDVGVVSKTADRTTYHSSMTF